MIQKSKTLLEYLDRLVKVSRLIQSERTGRRKDIARKLSISPRSVTNYIQALEHLGAEIEWDSIYDTYYFVNDFNIKISITINTK